MKRTGSFHPLALCLALLGLVLLPIFGCIATADLPSDTETTAINPNSEEEISFTEEEVLAIVDEIMNDDTTTIDTFSDEELEAFIDAMQEYGIYPDLEGESTAERSSLPYCYGYWGHYATAETIEKRNSTSGMLYHVGPNCYMWAPDSDTGDALNGDCSSASDNDTDDFMLSFYFGYHSESPGTLKSMLRWTSSSSWVRMLLGSLSGRLYDQTAGDGADNYNVYTCVDDYFDPYLTTFDLRKY